MEPIIKTREELDVVVHPAGKIPHTPLDRLIPIRPLTPRLAVRIDNGADNGGRYLPLVITLIILTVLLLARQQRVDARLVHVHAVVEPRHHLAEEGLRPGPSVLGLAVPLGPFGEEGSYKGF